MLNRFPCVDTHTIRWGVQKPSDPYEYRQLLATHGAKCFLMPKGTIADPNQPHYPICSYPTGCLSCSGLEAAYKRLSVYAKASPLYRQEPQRVEKLLKRAIYLALPYANSADPTNQCNWAYRAAKRHGIPVAQPQLKGVFAMFGRHMTPGECATTKGGVRYCYIPGKGVRFQKKGSTLRGFGQPTGQKCRKWKTVYSPVLGHNVRRCADFAGFGQPTGQKCQSYKYVTNKYGQRVRRCADFAGNDLGTTAGQHCVSWKTVYSPVLGHNVRRCADFEY